MVARLFWVSSTNSGTVRKPSSHAAWRALSSKPMLVGETRGSFGVILFLYIVGDQIVVALPAKLVEVAPDVERVTVQKSLVARRSGACSVRGAAVEPGGDDGDQAPNQQDWRGHEDGVLRGANAKIRPRQAARNERHHGQIAIDGCDLPGLRLCFCGRFPLQQALAGNEAANQRAHDGVDGEQRLVGQKEQDAAGPPGRLAELSRACATLPSRPLTTARPTLKTSWMMVGKEEQQQRNDGPVDGPARADRTSRPETG